MLVKRLGPVGAFIQLRLTLPYGSTNTHGDWRTRLQRGP